MELKGLLHLNMVPGLRLSLVCATTPDSSPRPFHHVHEAAQYNLPTQHEHPVVIRYDLGDKAPQPFILWVPVHHSLLPRKLAGRFVMLDWDSPQGMLQA